MTHDHRSGHFSLLYSVGLPSVHSEALTLLSEETSISVLPWRVKQFDLESRQIVFYLFIFFINKRVKGRGTIEKK